MKSQFAPGRNIAMKIPTHEYERTLSFYRDVVGLTQLPSAGDEDTPRFEFGDKVLWLDAVPGISQAEIWLELVTDDIEQAAALLERHGCHRRDEIEPLPPGFNAFWIASPSNIIHLVCTRDDL